jgi:hypothetical protein
MLRTEYCLIRAERLRMLMLTAPDPTAVIRLRGFIQKYRVLAERAKRKVESQPLNVGGSLPRRSAPDGGEFRQAVEAVTQIAALAVATPPDRELAAGSAAIPKRP